MSEIQNNEPFERDANPPPSVPAFGTECPAAGEVGGQNPILLTEEDIPPRDSEFAAGFGGRFSKIARRSMLSYIL